MGRDHFSLAVQNAAEGAVVWVSGDLDTETSAQLHECLESLNGASITVDFSAVTFLDSGGIAAIVRAMKHAARHDTTFALRDVQPNERRLLEIVGLAEQLDLDGSPRSSPDAHRRQPGPRCRASSSGGPRS